MMMVTPSRQISGLDNTFPNRFKIPKVDVPKWVGSVEKAAEPMVWNGTGSVDRREINNSKRVSHVDANNTTDKKEQSGKLIEESDVFGKRDKSAPVNKTKTEHATNEKQNTSVKKDKVAREKSAAHEKQKVQARDEEDNNRHIVIRNLDIHEKSPKAKKLKTEGPSYHPVRAVTPDILLPPRQSIRDISADSSSKTTPRPLFGNLPPRVLNWWGHKYRPTKAEDTTPHRLNVVCFDDPSPELDNFKKVAEDKTNKYTDDTFPPCLASLKGFNDNNHELM